MLSKGLSLLFISLLLFVNVYGNESLSESESYILRQKEFEQFLEKEPDNIYVLNNLGVVFLLKKEYNNAYNCFENIIKINKKYFNAYYNLGIIYFRQKNWIKLLEMCERAEKVFLDEESNILLLKTYSYYRMRKFESVKNLFEEIDRNTLDDELKELYDYLNKKIRMMP